MNKRNQITLITAIVLGISWSAQAQTLPTEGRLGLRASLSNQSTIEVPYILNETISIAPTLGFVIGENISNNFQVGVRTRFYRQTNDSLQPYISGNLIGNFVSDNVNILLGGGYGGEYFISNDFSLSAEGLINVSVGGSNLVSTGANVSATVYF